MNRQRAHGNGQRDKMCHGGLHVDMFVIAQLNRDIDTVVFLDVLGILALLTCISLWRDGRVATKVMRWRNDDWHRAVARAWPAFVVFNIAFDITCSLEYVASYQSTRSWAWPAYLISGTVMLLILPLNYSVYYYNRPRILIPPYMRNDPSVKWLRNHIEE